MTIQLSWYDPEQTIMHVRYSGIITLRDLEKMQHDKLAMQIGNRGSHYVIDDLTNAVAAKDLQHLIAYFQAYDKSGSTEEGHLIVAAPGMISTLMRSVLAIVGRARPDLTSRVQLVDTFDFALKKINRFKQVS